MPEVQMCIFASSLFFKAFIQKIAVIAMHSLLPFVTISQDNLLTAYATPW